jgi:adenylate cyclase
VRDPPLILIADDNIDNIEILNARLSSKGYATLHAHDGEEALEVAREHVPDAILLDVMMPKLDGIEVCRRLKADKHIPFMPILLVTAKTATQDVVAGLDAGADDYLTKPIDQAALMARLRSILRIKALQDTVQAQACRLEAQAAQLADWNQQLKARVDAQVGEIERMSRLRRFLSPQIADLILSSGEERVLESHRREVTVVFCDLRGFTAFAETAEPEEVMAVLSDYHAVLGPAIHRHEGTLERFLGDGLLVIFNDPVPCPNPAERAVRMAIEARDHVAKLSAKWRRTGYELGFGVGITQGYATLGRIGFYGRYDYAAIGSVTNLGARLCAEAQPGQILISQRVAVAVENIVEIQPVGMLQLKGFYNPVMAHNVVELVAS